MLSIATAAVFLATAFAVQAGGDPAAGKTKAKACAGCHGATGQGVKPNPKLAGLPEAELEQMMKDYKSGKRPNPVMKSMTSSLSEQDMANLAAYYSSLK
jgi:cytochrome c553